MLWTIAGLEERESVFSEAVTLEKLTLLQKMTPYGGISAQLRFDRVIFLRRGSWE